jgi:hypothetical protein
LVTHLQVVQVVLTEEVAVAVVLQSMLLVIVVPVVPVVLVC